MRSQTEIEQIREMKNKSSVEEKHFVIETRESREFFRYENNRLVEYELTKSYGRPIKYKPDEVEGEEIFEFSEL